MSDPSLSWQLKAELDVATWRAIAQSLKWRAGPPVGEDDPLEG